MARRLDAGDAGFEAAFAAIVTTARGRDDDVAGVVTDIIDDVRRRGDEALIELTRRFDRVELDADRLFLGADEIDAAADRCPADTVAALEFAARRIEDHHRRQMPVDLDYRDEAGVRLGARWTPVDAAGVYVPGGTAAYPSSVLMTALPAKVAGVGRVVMAMPTPGGALNPAALAAARLAGIDRILRVGGAQAIAALALGTATVDAVDVIVGPGNAYVAAAKRQLFGVVGIDTIAGPSEIVVVADDANDPEWIAADLLAQAEHDTAARSIMITDDTAFADAVDAAVERCLEGLDRADIARASWRDNGAILRVARIADAAPLIDRLAPEHLALAVADPDALAAKVRHAGAIFLGRYTPEAIGDYVAGPNHVLPTGRGARFSSGLSVLDFLKRSSIIGCDAASLARVGPAAITLAEAEGLGAHARSVALRLGPESKD